MASSSPPSASIRRQGSACHRSRISFHMACPLSHLESLTERPGAADCATAPCMRSSMAFKARSSRYRKPKKISATATSA